MNEGNLAYVKWEREKIFEKSGESAGAGCAGGQRQRDGQCIVQPERSAGSQRTGESESVEKLSG